MVASSASLSLRAWSSPSTPCISKSANFAFNVSSSPSNLSLSISTSEAAFAIRNFFVSNSLISAAWLTLSWVETVSLCCDDRVERLRESLRSAFSASRMRSSRDCCSVDIDSLIRPRASLSGWMLKLSIVWWMSCGAVLALLQLFAWKGSSSHSRWIFVEKHLDGCRLHRGIIRSSSACEVLR